MRVAHIYAPALAEIPAWIPRLTSHCLWSAQDSALNDAHDVGGARVRCMALRAALRGRAACGDRANERDVVDPRHEVPACARKCLDYLMAADLHTERLEKLYAR